MEHPEGGGEARGEDESESDEEYEVSEIKGYRMTDGAGEYLVGFRGYDEPHDEWLPRKNLDGAESLQSNELCWGWCQHSKTTAEASAQLTEAHTWNPGEPSKR